MIVETLYSLTISNAQGEVIIVAREDKNNNFVFTLINEAIDDTNLKIILHKEGESTALRSFKAKCRPMAAITEDAAKLLKDKFGIDYKDGYDNEYYKIRFVDVKDIKDLVKAKEIEVSYGF